MAALKAPFGFKPCRNITGGTFNPTTVRHRVDGASGVQRAIFTGDAVVVASGNTVTPVACSVDNAQITLGVVMQCLDANQKPLVFSQPIRGPYLPAGTSGFVDVYIDNSNTYIVATDASATPVVMNRFVGYAADASAGATNLAVGRSAFAVTMTSATQAMSLTHPWRVVGPNLVTRDYLTNQDWVDGLEVILAKNLVNAS